MKKEELIKSLVDKNPDVLKNAEALIKEYPEECKGLTPEEFIYRTSKLKAWTELPYKIQSNAGKFEEVIPEKYRTLLKLREYWEVIDNKLRNPEYPVSDKFPEALKSLQLLDDKGYLNIKTTETPKKIVGIRGECGMSVWERGSKLAKRIRAGQEAKIPAPEIIKESKPEVIEEDKVNPRVAKQPIDPQIIKGFIDRSKGIKK
ncbi:MAG: hypothetical protein II830_02490 [Alphaproteobacteria bacterium]|nr:hypothetical protein [Alphaproteobacteria bacterium]